MTIHQAKKAVPPPNVREAILWILVVLCQIGYPLGPIVGQLTGVPFAAHTHAAPAVAEGPSP